MSNANRDYAIVYDVKNSSLVLSRPLNFYITDKNTSNIFIKLVTRVIVGNGIDQYTDIENASNYVLTMRVIKPNNEVKSLEATQHEPENIFQFDLTEDFKDMPGKYICELTISTTVSGRQELITSDPFNYKVKQSILSNVGEIIETEDTTVEKLLNDLNATKAELSSQIKEKATKQEVEIERKRIDNIISLPEGSTAMDAEVMDGRVGVDGTNYPNIGTSIRTQIYNINNELEHVVYKRKVQSFNLYDNQNLEIDTYITKNSSNELVYISDDTRVSTKMIELNSNNICIYFKKLYRYTTLIYYCLLDKNKKVLNSVVSEHSLINSYKNLYKTLTFTDEQLTEAKYIAFTFNKNGENYKDIVISNSEQPILGDTNYLNYEKSNDYIYECLDEYSDNINYVKQNLYNSVKPQNYYDEVWRPKFHFSAENGYMNDPCGFVFYKGMYHLYFQYNPYTIYRDNQTWGHAISDNMVNWTMCDVAIDKTNEYDIWTGSCIVDEKNDAGFGANTLLAFVTEYYKDGTQSNALYYSFDGNNFTRHGTILTVDNSPTPTNKAFRDPKVIFDPNMNCWIMVLACENCIGIYKSSNLINWTYLNKFTTDAGIECPNLIYLEDYDVYALLYSINNSMKYHIGKMTSDGFRPLNETPLVLDNGFNYYAMQCLTNAPDKKIYSIAWVNTQGKEIGSTNKGWNGMMSTVRELGIKNTSTDTSQSAVLTQNIPNFYNCVFRKIFNIKSKVSSNHPIKLPIKSRSGRLKVVLDYNGITEQAKYPEVNLFVNQQEKYIIQYNVPSNKIIHNRTNCGDKSLYKGIVSDFSNEVSLIDGKLYLDIIFDNGIVETIINDSVSITDAVFPYADNILIKCGSGNFNVEVEYFDSKYTLDTRNKLNTNLGKYDTLDNCKLTVKGLSMLTGNNNFTQLDFEKYIKNTDYKIICNIFKGSYSSSEMKEKIIFAKTNEKYYFAEFDSTSIKLYKNENSSDSLLGSKDITFNDFVDHLIIIQLSDSSIIINVDGAEVLNVEDTGNKEGTVSVAGKGYGLNAFNNILAI